MDKPLVSFCILTYNQEKYIKDAINGAINQDYNPMEIIISDDHSTDKTYSIIKNMIKSYRGTHQIIFNENTRNIGIRNHFNKVVYELAHGDIIEVAAGDDVSLPQRTQTTVNFFEKNPEVKSLHYKSLQVDKNLKPLPYNNKISEGLNTIITLEDYLSSKMWLYSGDSRAFRKEVIDKFPPLTISHNEDLPTFIRSIILGPTALIRQPLVWRRIDGNNVSLTLHKKQEGKDLFIQLTNDMIFSLQKGYITKEEYIRLNKKIKNIWIDMKFYDLSMLFPHLMKIYNKLMHIPHKIIELTC
jgi:glycosyltransferase involved in cell wall biosynthesis